MGLSLRMVFSLLFQDTLFVDRREIFFGVGLLQVRTTTSDRSVFLLSFLVEQEQGPENNYCRSLWLFKEKSERT